MPCAVLSAEGHQEPECAQGHERRREEPAGPAQDPFQRAVRVEGLEPQVEQVPPDATPSMLRNRCARRVAFQEAAAPKALDEPLQGLQSERRPEALLDPPAHAVERRRPVELPGHEVLDLSDAEEAPRGRLLDDEDHPLAGLLPAEDQVTSQAELCTRHRRHRAGPVAGVRRSSAHHFKNCAGS